MVIKMPDIIRGEHMCKALNIVVIISIIIIIILLLIIIIIIIIPLIIIIIIIRSSRCRTSSGESRCAEP